jgi:hypothetical protein
MFLKCLSFVKKQTYFSVKGLHFYYYVIQLRQNREGVAYMKKILSLVFCCLFLLGFSSCDPGVNNLDRDDLIDNTVKIELYDYENKNPELIRVKGNEKPEFDFSKATLIGALEEDHFEDILNDISEWDYLLFGTALNEPMGKTLVLHQKDGNMIVMFGCSYTDRNNKTFYYGDCYVFTSDGVFVEHIGDVGHLFSERVESTYFQTESQDN